MQNLRDTLLTNHRWPAIIGIIIGSLILISVIWCCARCLCCGLSCCCDCFTCCGMCQRRGGRRNRNTEGPPAFAPYQGYQPMPAPPAYQAPPPQFATFEGKVHEDSLPAMPSWDNAASRRVEDKQDDMELDHMPAQAAGPLASGARASRGSYSQVPQQQHSPYGNGPEPYRNGDSYGSDLGAQNLSGQNTRYGGAAPSLQYYDNNHLTSPTYGGASSRGRPSMPGGFQSYTSQDAGYNSGFQQASSAPAHAGYTPSFSTQYAPSTAAPSYHTNYVSPTEGRPPSLLQVGRKPVQNSAREV